MKKLLPIFCIVTVFLLSSCQTTNQTYMDVQKKGGSTPDKGNLCFKNTENEHAAINNKCSEIYVEGDYSSVRSKWEALAEQGNVSAMYNMGFLYYRGQGVAKDKKLKTKWFKLAANKGFSAAQLRLGEDLHDEGDIIAAAEWYRLAANQGNTHAEFILGEFYENGIGVAKDYKEAIKWYKRSAQQGNAASQHNLGNIYLFARGVTQDYVQAHMWFNLAASQGVERSAHNRDRIERRMSFSQLEKAQELARNFKFSDKSGSLPSHEASSSGSGFFVTKTGHVITNEHVVNGCNKLTIGDDSKKQVPAELLEVDKKNDLALLKISSTNIELIKTNAFVQKTGVKIAPVAFAGLLRSGDVTLGEDVLVAGFPYGEIFSDTIKVTKGIVSANRGFQDDSGQFQIDAAVQPGNSGGPIYDGKGNIVGVVIAQLDKIKLAKNMGSIPENVNFGIKASTVRQFLSSAGLLYKNATRSRNMSSGDIAKVAKRQTVMVMCER